MDNKVNLSRRNFLKRSSAGALFLLGGGMLGISGCSPRAEKQLSAQSLIENSNGAVVELGTVQELKQGPHPKKMMYKTKIKDGWYENPMEGFVYITKDSKTGKIMILSPVCTHLGCTVPEASPQQKEQASGMPLEFQCPCHGGQYDSQGRNIGGPPPRPLDFFEPILLNDKIYIHILKPVKREA